MHVLSAHAHDWPRMYMLHDIHSNDTGLCMDGMKKLPLISYCFSAFHNNMYNYQELRAKL